MENKKLLLRTEHLVKEFPIGGTKKNPLVVHAVSDVNLEIYEGETLALVGESGCGKSTLGRLLIRLLDVTSGKVEFEGQDITAMKESEFAKIRRQLQIIFQDPYASLNPRMSVAKIIAEPLTTYGMKDKKELEARVKELMKAVGIPEEFYNRYPHQFSGGMRQRVMIAMALCCNPAMLICDEPTTALDVTIQAQILDLINELKEKTGTSVMMITHDLGVIAEVADDVMVMYAGKVVEHASCDQIFDKPMHPYTDGLMKCIPKLDDDDTKELSVIKGMVPSFDDMPAGCAFCPRCPQAREICRQKMPELVEAEGRMVRCFKYTKEWEENI